MPVALLHGNHWDKLKDTHSSFQIPQGGGVPRWRTTELAEEREDRCGQRDKLGGQNEKNVAEGK